eukprot:GEMP01037877.1.p1 GENE.GEMP01037877.1~~GEMP01037877.1.p1  ORF type:complete len:354 (+),score=63.29 GEMP01037877.1:361-1422(+)
MTQNSGSPDIKGLMPHFTLLRMIVVCGLMVTADAASFRPRSFDDPIDLVYTWVATPNATEQVAIKHACPLEKGGIQRWRDMDIFRVALPLALQNLPWIRTIYVVTNGRVPDWLKPADFAHGNKIKFVTHKEMWKPEWQHDLPTYASTAIETHLHRIKDLAEHFIYANDDMLFLKPISRSDMFDADGMPHFFTDKFGDTADWKSAQRNFVPGVLPDKPGSLLLAHMPYIWRKSFIEEAHQKWAPTFETVSHSTCRGVDFVATVDVYDWYHVVVKGATPSKIREFTHAYGEPMGLFAKDNDQETRLRHIRDFLGTVRESKPYMLCISDDFDQDEKKGAEQIAIVKELLAEIDPMA